MPSAMPIRMSSTENTIGYGRNGHFDELTSNEDRLNEGRDAIASIGNRAETNAQERRADDLSDRDRQLGGGAKFKSLT